MINNNEKGLYHIGEHSCLPCGCIVVAEEIGYTHYVNQKCKLDNKFHPLLKGYQYQPIPIDTVDTASLHYLKGSI